MRAYSQNMNFPAIVWQITGQLGRATYIFCVSVLSGLYMRTEFSCTLICITFLLADTWVKRAC